MAGSDILCRTDTIIPYSRMLLADIDERLPESVAPMRFISVAAPVLSCGAGFTGSVSLVQPARHNEASIMPEIYRRIDFISVACLE